MSIGKITSNYPAGYEVKRTTRSATGKHFDHTALAGPDYIKEFTDTTRQTSVLELYNRISRSDGTISKAVETNSILSRPHAIGEPASNDESETKTDIIVKPDGSRVLVMTMSVGGMETTMSLEISKPTKAPNETSKQATDDNMSNAENDTVSDEMSVISNDD